MSFTAIRSLIDLTSFGIYVHFVFAGFIFLDALGASKLRIISPWKPCLHSRCLLIVPKPEYLNSSLFQTNHPSVPLPSLPPFLDVLHINTRVRLCLLCAKLFQLCPNLCNSMDHSPPGSSVHGILQTRVLEWVAMPSFRGSSQSRDQAHVLSLPHW